MTAFVTKAISNTDNATIAVRISGVPCGGSPLTIPAGSIVGSSVTQILSAPNDSPQGVGCTLIPLKTTAGGKCNLTLTFIRL